MTPASAPQPLAHRLGDALRLWWAPLDAPGAADAYGLGPPERERQARFRFARDAHRYAAAQTALRQVLAAEAGVAPAVLAFALSPSGKPHLPAWPGLHFNLSHSGPWALIGVHRHTHVGVDIEVLAPQGDLGPLARRHFTPSEQAELAQHDDAGRLRAFLRCWTRKEACVKACGTGLSVEPHTFDAGTGPALRRVTVQAPDGARWRLHAASVELPLDALASVAWGAVEG